MKHSVPRVTGSAIAVSSLLFCWLLLPGRAGAQPVVWVASDMVRIGASDAPGSGTQAQLWAGRGECEAFQIIVRAPSGGLSNVNVTVSDLSGPGGQTIPRSSYALYREKYVYVSPGSPNWGGSNQPLGAGWYPDALIPFTDPATGAPLSGASLQAVPFNLAGNTNQPIWVDLLVPRSAPAGQYNGTFTVTSAQGSVSGSVVLNVWNFTLPLTPSLHSSFLYWTAGSLAAQEELLRHKIAPLATSPSNQSLLMNSYGLGSTGLPFWSGADVSTCSMSPAPSVSQFQASASAQQPGLLLYDYSADEIGNCSNLITTIKQWAYNMHQAGVKNLITMSPNPLLYDDGSGTGRSAVDIWTMLPIMYDQNVSAVNYVLQKGDAAWSYNALVQDSYSPKWLIDFAPMNFRIQPGFISQALGLTGMLYWRVDDWSSDPWNQVNNTGTFSSNNYPGEGMLVYPGQQVGINGVVASMRLKYLREGVEDYEYVQMLKNLGQGTWAMNLVRTIASSWSNWTRDPNALASVRMQLGQQLHSLSGGAPTSSGSGSSGGTTGSTTAPAAPTSPSPANGATGVSTSPTLSWSPSSGAASYDVYFGTASNPPLAGSVTTATYTPGTLSSGTTYFWKVVAKNSVGTAASPVWSFSTSAPVVSSSTPAAVSVTPSSGSGMSAVFSLVYSDPSGAADIAGAGALINATFNGQAACWFYYDRASNQISLASNDTTTWTAMTLGSGNSLSNSQCSISGSGSSATASGTNLTLNVAVTFQSAFAGPKTTYLYVQNKAGQSNGYQAKGTWTVSSAPVPPVAVSVSPSSGSGFSSVFQFVYSDGNGASDIAGAGALINGSFNGQAACWFYYDRASNQISLASDSTANWSAITVGSGGVLKNSQCSIAGVSVSAAASNLTVTVPITFQANFAGSKAVYMYVQDKEGQSNNYQNKGSWIVP